MGFLDGFLNKMNMGSNEDYDGEFDDSELMDDLDEEEAAAAVKPEPKPESAPAMDEPIPSTTVFRKKTTKSSAKVVPMQNGTPVKQSEVCMIIPKEYNNTKEIAEILLSGKTVVLNMEAMNYDTAQRVIDFTSGACFTMGGNLQKISKKIIIATPSNVELSGDFTELLGEEDASDLATYNLKV